MYCVKCRKKTNTLNLQNVVSKNNRNMQRGNCAICGRLKTQFVSSKTGGDLVSSINSATRKIKLPWSKFPGEMHLPGMNFSGPGTNLDERLTSTDAYKEWSKPIDRVDNAAYHHDLAYKYLNDTANRNLADKMMIEELDSIKNPTIRERIERGIIKPIISSKANENIIWLNLNGNARSEKVHPKFLINDRVRITKKKSTFEKGYTPRWTEEVFAISKIQYTDPPTYKITDYNGEEIHGTFYEPELQKTNQEIFRIEKVIRKLKNKSFVKWYGYPDSFNSWVDNKKIEKIII
ncbi:uncharacterized protein LOC136074610 [Hydra vulgaris]|uniref:Uncharacterized protein LOC136074610 n=1 Tax=Hydra vulgaris TaxID=6087 RepID=A0ABM4B2J6_HYDVU